MGSFLKYFKNALLSVFKYVAGVLIWIPYWFVTLLNKAFFLGMAFVVYPIATMYALKFFMKFPPVIHYTVLAMLFLLLFYGVWSTSKEEFLENYQKLDKKMVYLPLILALSFPFVAIYCIADLTNILYHNGALQISSPYKVDYDQFANYYTWQLLNLVPQLKLVESFHWVNPLTYTDSLTALLTLVFQAFVVFIIFKAIYKWFEWKKKKEHKEKWWLINGDKLYSETAGSGEVMILIHGIALDRRMWDAQYYTLARYYKVIRYDMRGFGKSTSIQDSDVFTHDSDLVQILNRLNISRVHIVGFEMGARIALDFALQNPERLISLTLVSPYLSGYLPPNFSLSKMNERAIKYGKKIANYILMSRLIRKFPPEKNPDLHQNNLLEELTTIISSYSGNHWLKPELLNTSPLTPDQLQRIKAPTFIFCGGKALKEIQEDAIIIHKNINGSRLYNKSDEVELFNQTGHYLTVEDPSYFTSLLVGRLSFLEVQNESLDNNKTEDKKEMAEELD